MARSSRALARLAGSATETETIVIVCEGEKTEEIYFNGIRKEFRLATTYIKFIGLGADPLTVVKQAEELKSDYDHAWAVFDVESAGHHGQRHSSLDAAIARAEQAGIHYAVSHPCFELWLILHFKLHSAYLSNTDARRMVSRLNCGYDAKGFDFAKVWPFHPVALRHADQLDKQMRSNHKKLEDRNPWTSVHELVRKLLAIAGGMAPGTVVTVPAEEHPNRRGRPPQPRRRRGGGR